MRPDLERIDSSILISFRLLFLLLELGHLLTSDGSLLLCKFLLQLFKFNLVLPQKGLLIQIFIDSGFVLNLFGSSREFKSLMRLVHRVKGGTDHRHHSGFTVTSKRVFQ